MSTSYAASKGAPGFDWNAFLSKDPKRISELEWIQAVNLAEDWVTCACGNQCASIPRNFDGYPEDLELAKLGRVFYKAIREREWKFARHILLSIEARSAQLISELS